MSLSSLHEIGNGNGKKLEEQKGKGGEQVDGFYYRFYAKLITKVGEDSRRFQVFLHPRLQGINKVDLHLRGTRKISPKDESTSEKLAAYLHSNQKS